MMIKSPEPTLHKTTRPEITALFGEAKLVLEETPKAISPFGGLASFISFLGQIGFARQVQQPLPFAEPTSNNAIPLAHALTAFLLSVVVGAQRFAHCEWLRADHVLHALLCGAVLGVMGRDAVVKLSAAWGGLRQHKPLVDATLDWLNCASPKLIPPADRLPIGGGLI